MENDNRVQTVTSAGSVEKESLKGWFPKRARPYIRNLYYMGGDLLDFVLGRTEQLTPPRKLRRLIGPGADIQFYKKVGEEFFQLIVRVCALKPSESILDVGCGSGRMAVPLTSFLNQDGVYKGFDIEPEAIRWCNKKIASRFPNFDFQIADLFNTGYNPNGKYQASEYKFPYEGESFDVVIACSVFTHMVAKDTENYLSEIARVLKPGGRCLLTYLLINEESERLIREGKSSLPLTIEVDVHRLLKRENPEAAVGFEEDFIRQLYRKYGLEEHDVHYGTWCGREQGLTYQDVIVAFRNRNEAN